jgi:hypothetical protein
MNDTENRVLTRTQRTLFVAGRKRKVVERERNKAASLDGRFSVALARTTPSGEHCSKILPNGAYDPELRDRTRKTP